ncbi:flagellar basal body-associated FliL family protein [Pseudooceanicola sp.]|uniref:flagellar basal body-associated FliL family protein n=1 Tax=Pseudooceanicola sp. TaxID=1914328 RepID=UPI00405849F4
MADAERDKTGRTSLGKRLIRWIGVLVLCVAALLAGIVAALGPERAMALLNGTPPAEAVPAPAQETAAAESGDGHGGTPAGPTEKIVVTPFKEIIVNISATTATRRETSRFLKLNLALVYDEAVQGADQVEPRKLFLRDSFQEYLRQLNEVDLQGSVGLVNLKSELLRRARAISDSEAPQEILIADLIVQ